MTNSIVYDGCLTNNVYFATRNHLSCLEAPHIVALMDEKLHLPFHNLFHFFSWFGIKSDKFRKQ